MTTVKKVNPDCAGGYFDDFLREEGIYEEITNQVAKEVIAWQIIEEMRIQGISKSDMAKRMETSRSSVDRLLDPKNDALTFSTLSKAAAILGKELRVQLV